MFAWIFHWNSWVELGFLTLLQVILGVDNIVLITILTRTLTGKKRDQAQSLGVMAAMVSRLILLGGIFWLAHFSRVLTVFMGIPVSIKGIVLAVGGLFLIAKATREMFDDMEVRHQKSKLKGRASLLKVLVQVFFLDVIFSMDQVLTAVGMSHELVIQVLSVVASVVVMALFVKSVAKVLDQHPSLRMIALSFLVLIGVSLMAEGTAHPFPHGYLYFGMAYALVVEVINIRRRSKVAHLKATESHDLK